MCTLDTQFNMHTHAQLDKVNTNVPIDARFVQTALSFGPNHVAAKVVGE